MAQESTKPNRRRQGLRRAAQIAAGTLCGLLLAEVAFRIRDDGAFPHLNCYVADATYGVRLRPGAETSIRFGGAPATNVRINAAGFRDDNDGAEPPVRPDETLFVGDSQTFGLGVEFDETFAARYAKVTGKPSYNAGVPTWGPPEFERAIGEIGKRRHPKTVVYVVNFANDAFEAERPNTARHTEWDGWAVRRETAPAHVTQFPGRELLFGRSHLFFALRGWWHQRAGKPQQDVDRGMPSEGTFRDLVKVGTELSREQLDARAETARRAGQYESEASYAQEAYRVAESHVRSIVQKKLKPSDHVGYYTYDENAPAVQYLAADANPGDIVFTQEGEAARSVAATAAYIRKAVELRKKLESELRALVEANSEAPDSKSVLTALEARDEERRKLQQTREKQLEIVRASSPLTSRVLAAKASAEAAGARFVLLVVPLDVMVSHSEWGKHGGGKVDLSSAQVLVDDLVESVRRQGGVALDATEALRAAEPGAFLPADIHMTPKGHDAVAKALAKELSAPTAAKKDAASELASALGAPGRSRMPPPEVWDNLAGEIAVNGSGGCPVTKKYREWLYVRCRPANASAPQGVGLEVTKGAANETITWVHDGGMVLVAPIAPRSELEALFSWSNGTSKRLRLAWDPAGVAPELSMTSELGVTAKAPGDSATAEKICSCYQAGHPGQDCKNLVANADATCLAAYSNDCSRLLACAARDPLVAIAVNEKASDGAPSGEAVEAAGAALIATAQAFVGPKCQLYFDGVSSNESAPYDHCPADRQVVDQYAAALAAFDGARLQGLGATFRDKARAFGNFTRLALQSETTRGTAAFLQDLTLAYNAWQPKRAVPVDPPRMVALYFGVTGERDNDWWRNVHRDGQRRKADFDASGQHFEWRRGPHGWEGPYLPGEPRTGFSY